MLGPSARTENVLNAIDLNLGKDSITLEHTILGLATKGIVSNAVVHDIQMMLRLQHGWDPDPRANTTTT